MSLKLVLDSDEGIILSNGDYLVIESTGKLCIFDNSGGNSWRVNLGFSIFHAELDKSETSAYWIVDPGGVDIIYFGSILNDGTFVFSKTALIPEPMWEDHKVFVSSTRVIFYISIDTPLYANLFTYDLDSNELISAVGMT